MSFSFGFSGDDIDADGEEEVGNVSQRATALANLPALSTAKSHDVEELVGRFFCSLNDIENITLFDLIFFHPSCSTLIFPSSYSFWTAFLFLRPNVFELSYNSSCRV
jgi:hypothetical protein